MLLGKGKTINPPAWQLFQPTHTRRLKPSEPTLKGLVDSLYASSSTSVVFQYVGPLFGSNPNYTSDEDLNVDVEEEVVTSITLPVTIPQLAASCTTSTFCRHTYTMPQVRAMEEATKGQSSNPDWMKYHLGRITASTIHRVMTKVEMLKILRPNVAKTLTN